MVSIDPGNGNIVAMASSGTYQESNFNSRCPRPSPAGPPMKVYVLTIKDQGTGVDPDATTYESRVLNLNLPEYGPWRVTTAEGSACGCSMSIREATQASTTRCSPRWISTRLRERARHRVRHGHRDDLLDAVPAEEIAGCGSG